jgi:hypothetical protein
MRRRSLEQHVTCQLRRVSHRKEYGSRRVTVPWFGDYAAGSAVRPHKGSAIAQVVFDERIKGFSLQLFDRSGVVATRFRDRSRGAYVVAHLMYGGGDATSQGNGGDERDEGCAEQHC